MKTHRLPSFLIVSVAVLAIGVALLPSGRAWAQSEIIYDSVPAIYPGTFPSLGYEATSTDEFGDYVALTKGGDLGLVTVSLTNWACENDFSSTNGTWTPLRDGYAGDACVTTPGSGFTHPITVNIYEVDLSGSEPAVGPQIATKTQNRVVAAL